ncbi:MAG: site-specific DNA-methyltransferase, partial [Chloroflexi bacterium]
MIIDKIKKMLGKPYYEAPNCLVYCGDCLDLLQELEDEFVDLTITSPPYNIGKVY